MFAKEPPLGAPQCPNNHPNSAHALAALASLPEVPSSAACAAAGSSAGEANKCLCRAPEAFFGTVREGLSAPGEEEDEEEEEGEE
eukprot:9551357-Alexandrium_andersonii.AAC.1